MTTRRRRTPSETCGEDPNFLLPALPENFSAPNTKNNEGVPVPWIGGATISNQAYYKKTDSPQVNNQTNPLLWATNTPQLWQPNNSWQHHQSPLLPSPQPPVPVNNLSGPVIWPSDSSSNQWNTTNGASFLANSNYGMNSSNNFSSNLSKSDLSDNGDMASRDRTQEFARIIRSQQGSHSNGMIPLRNSKRPQDIRQYTEFMQRSKLIGRNIASTYAKLEKLTHLAKKRSLFDDSQDKEIQELTGIIRHDLTSLTKQLEDLRNRSHLHSSLLTNGSGHLQKHSANLVGSLQSKVANITQMFKDVLEVRTENLKKQAERRDQFTGAVISGALPSAAVSGHHQGSVLIADEYASAGGDDSRLGATGGEVAINMGGGMYQQQLNLMEEQDTYLQSRADTMKTIESTIVELGQMFTQLATMVKEQEELVHRIDSNVDDAEMNIEAAHSELLKYFKNVSSNRMLMIKVFGIMIVFFVVFVVFMA